MNNHIVMIEDMLRPCPFCGALVRLKSVDETDCTLRLTIKCPRCGVEVTMAQQYRIGPINLVPVNEHPVTTWNRRTEDARLLRNQKTRQ